MTLISFSWNEFALIALIFLGLIFLSCFICMIILFQMRDDQTERYKEEKKQQYKDEHKN